ncbi:MAG: AMP-binding protein, partial [Actinobacteria bacterium]|nr:AMP-binding protein [Actinomycetota bacterium]
QWIAALPVSSMGGFNVLIRALDAGREPIALASLGGAEPFTPIDFQRAVHRAAASSSDIRVSLVAAQVRRLLADDTGVDALLGCSQVLVGAGPLPAVLLETANTHGIRLTRTYGATETSGGCVFNGEPLPGVSITIDRTREDAPGEVLLSGPMLALGYRMDQASTAARFTPLGYRTGDLGTVDDDRLTLQGRIDDVVVVNGVNVALGAIERVVETLPGSESCAALALPLGEGEVEIVLLVVGSDAIPGLRHDISQAVRAALGRPAVPRRVAVVPEFPTLPNRKLDRAALRALATEPGRVAWLP